MVTRREVIAGLATTGALALAGCGCDGTVEQRFSLTLDGIRRTDDGWAVDATATVQFSTDVKLDLLGVTLGGYAADRTSVGTAPLGDFRWEDVPEKSRSEGDCGESGSLSRSTTLTTDGFPSYLGPQFQPDTRPGRGVAVRGLAYAPDGETPTFDERGPPADASDGRPGPDAASADDFLSIPIEGYPWPPAVEQAVFETDAIAAVGFVPDGFPIDDRNEPRLDPDPHEDGRDVSVSWAMAIPEESCLRPFIEDLAYDADGERLEATVGVHRLERAPCGGGRYLRYTVWAGFRGGRRPVSRATVVHVDESGDVVERIQVLPDR